MDKSGGKIKTIRLAVHNWKGWGNDRHQQDYFAIGLDF